MRELSIEEKAKRYDEAIEKAKYYYDEGKTLEYASDITSYIFPELRESEDERIRKWLIALIKSNEYGSISNVGKMPCSKLNVLAWLKKQGEQKPADKVELKFKVGDVVTNKKSKDTVKIVQILHDSYCYSGWDGAATVHSDFSISEQDDWELVKQKPAFETKTPEESLGIDSDTYNKIVDECVYGEQISANETPYPETLEEAIDLYYNSYGNGEGEFEHLSLEKFRDIVHTFVSDYGQKPAWSEEDETTKNNISHIIRQYDKISKRENQPCCYVGDCLLWMQNIKDRVQPQPKQEWSEGDERIINNLVSQLGNLYARKLIKEETKDKYVTWLKSLRPQNTWKPSDEQMEALKQAKTDACGKSYFNALASLYVNLKGY